MILNKKKHDMHEQTMIEISWSYLDCCSCAKLTGNCWYIRGCAPPHAVRGAARLGKLGNLGLEVPSSSPTENTHGPGESILSVAVWGFALDKVNRKVKVAYGTQTLPLMMIGRPSIFQNVVDDVLVQTLLTSGFITMILSSSSLFFLFARHAAPSPPRRRLCPFVD